MLLPIDNANLTGDCLTMTWLTILQPILIDHLVNDTIVLTSTMSIEKQLTFVAEPWGRIPPWYPMVSKKVRVRTMTSSYFNKTIQY